MFRSLNVLVLLATLLVTPLTFAQPQQNEAETEALSEYEAQMRAYDAELREQDRQEYERRVEAQRQWEAQHRWRNLMPVLLFMAIVLLLLVYSQIAARRRYVTVTSNSRADVARVLQQNDRIIELLTSINERLDHRS